MLDTVYGYPAIVLEYPIKQFLDAEPYVILRDDVKNWCDYNMSHYEVFNFETPLMTKNGLLDEYQIYNLAIYSKSENDLILFKLRWL